MKTPYSIDNAKLSQQAHECALETIYPALFGVNRSRLTFDAQTLLNDSMRGQVLDGEMAVDRVARVKVPRLRRPLVFTIQERFRRPEWAHKRDITITEWNHLTNQPGELYKLEANLFVYGYFNQQTASFIEVVAIDVPKLFRAIINDTIPYGVKKNPRTRQTFLTITFDNLTAKGLIVYHHKPHTLTQEHTGAATRSQAIGRIAKYNTICRHCRKPITKQVDRIVYTGLKGWIHIECLPFVKTENMSEKAA